MAEFTNHLILKMDEELPDNLAVNFFNIVQKHGPEDIVQTMALAYNKNKWMVPAPAIGVKMMASIFERFSWFPITKDQVTMLLENNVCDSTEHFKDFEIEPIPYNEETLNYLKSY